MYEYDYGQAGAYFVTVCTQGRKCILSTIVGGDAHIAPNSTNTVGADAHIGPRVVLTDTGAVVEKYLTTIPGIGEYVIMPNHVHMILRISSDDLLQGPMWASAPTRASVPNLIRSWKTLVTKELGRSIWQRSYYDHIIRSEKDYWQILRYIEENPAKWCDDTYYSPM